MAMEVVVPRVVVSPCTSMTTRPTLVPGMSMVDWEAHTLQTAALELLSSTTKVGFFVILYFSKSKME